MAGTPSGLYEVYELGDTWAEIREGYRGPIWARERNDWSVPGRIEWTAVDSGFATPGSHVVVAIQPAEGGSTLHVTWERRGRGVFGKLFVGLMALTRGLPSAARSKPASPGSQRRPGPIRAKGGAVSNSDARRTKGSQAAASLPV